jgi:2-haloacid dehalogenase
MPIRNVVFDLGGVLIEWDPRRLYRTIFDDEKAMDRFLAEVCTVEWNAEQDAGRPWAEAIASLTAVHPEYTAEIAAFRDRWIEMLGGPIQSTVDVLAALRHAGKNLYALSNWSHETFAVARPLPEYDFLDWFDGIVISGEERICKPDPRIFRLLLDRYGLRAEETLFIDDSPGNVEAARGMGMVAVRFADGPSLRATLSEMGLLDGTGPRTSARPGSMG